MRKPQALSCCMLAWLFLPSGISAQGPTIEELQKLLASDTAEQDSFGEHVAIHGDTLVVAARFDDDDGTSSGSVYVYERSDDGSDTWNETRKLTASDASSFDFFGSSVAIHGDTIVIGADHEDTGGSRSGSAYVFERNLGGADNWGQSVKLTASDPATQALFGTAVSIHLDTLAVAASGGGFVRGSAYVFERDLGGPGNWGELIKLTAPDGEDGDGFGEAISLHGDTLVVGAELDDNVAGSAYIFERDFGGVDNWGQVTKLTAPDASAGDRFGIVSIENDTLVVGAFSDDEGSAYVFERDFGGVDNWGQVTKLTASDSTRSGSFGFSVSISGDTILVGAIESNNAYVFERNFGGANNWGETLEVIDSDGTADDRFGTSVSQSGEFLVIGAIFDDDACPANPDCNSGSAVVFRHTPAVTDPALSIPANIPTPANLPVEVPIQFASNGRSIAATTFSVDIDQACLNVDPTDGDDDGILDALVFSVPGDFTPSVTFAAADTMGELDFVIADFSPPLAELPDGVIATLTVRPICIPADTSIVAPVGFGQTPIASFGDTAGQSVSGTTADGSVEILSGTPGDCNDAGDISACSLEVFDGDGDVWSDVVNGTFAGSPVGCDANQDFVVDAGDFSCKILLIFNGAGACAPPPLGPGLGTPPATPQLQLGHGESLGPAERVQISLSIDSGGHAITASAFSIDYDETCLTFDPADGLAFHLPPGITPSVSFDPADRAGELDIAFFDPSLPFATLGNGVLATLTFTNQCEAAAAERVVPIRFGATPRPSFGDIRGRSLQGNGLDGGVSILRPLFRDGFESGDTEAWAETVN